MHKLPVLDVAGRAYAFLLNEWRTILRLTWFPLLVVGIAQFLASTIASRPVFAGFTVWELASLACMLAAGAIVAVALHRTILFGDRKPGVFILLTFGKVEALFAILPAAMFLIYAMGHVLFYMGIAVAMMSGAPASAAALIFMLPFVVAVLVAIRLSLIFPVTVVKGRYDFGAAWRLMRGNFWRAVGVWILALGPLHLIAGSIQPAVMRSVAPGIWRGVALALVNYPIAIISSALMVAAVSYSYKALSGQPLDEPIAPEA